LTSPSHTPVRITIVHQAALGDTVLLIPLFRALRHRFTGARITLVSKTNLGQMLTMLGMIENHASADDRDHTAWFSPPAPPDHTDRPNSRPAWADCDYLLCAVANKSDPWAQNAYLARPDAEPKSLLFFEPRPPASYPGHVTQWHRDQLGELDLIEPQPPFPKSNPDGVVLIHPGSGGDNKCWPRERFISLGHTLKRNGIIPTFLLGEVEQEKWGRNLIEEMKREFPWYLHMGLYELAEKISRARFFLGNDSGVTHLAAAMGIPVLALFGPSNDVQWAPVGPSVKIVRAASDPQNLDALEQEVVLSEVLAELRKL
jgi:ADP-heptose:LPS heptosyltransferase